MIAKRLRAARTRKGWSREELAYHSGVSWSAIAQIESGRRTKARPATLAALAGALRVTIDYLIGENSSPAMLDHRALVYGSDEEFVAATAPFLQEGVERAEAVLVVTTSGKIELLRKNLGGDARRIVFADSAEWYRSPLDAVSAYGSFSDEKIAAGVDWMRIVGEPVAASQDREEVKLWSTYESIFNVMFAGSPLTAVCPYDARSSTEPLVDMVMETHPQLVAGEETAPNDRYRDPEQLLLGEES